MDSKIKDLTGLTQKRINHFWSKVKILPNNDCWEWQASTIGGYGQTNICRQQWLAHRFSWFLRYGFQSKIFLLHSCDNRKCVNPNHLREGTHLDNAHDRVLRNRSAIGGNHGRAKLTAQDIPKIEELYFIEKHTYSEIAAIYKVTKAAITDILGNRSWKHIPRKFEKTNIRNKATINKYANVL